MQHRGEAVDHAGDGERAERLERLRGHRHPLDEAREPEPARDTDGDADDEREEEFAARAARALVADAEVREQGEHHGDPDGVVRAGLALQDRAAPSDELTLAEDGETAAGSVGARAAPISAELAHDRPTTRRATSVIAAAVANVPRIPRFTIGQAPSRKRRRPTCIPPSKRIRISATVTTRSTCSGSSSCS